MQNRFKLLFSSTAIALALPGAAVADVSASDVWNSFQSYVSNFGYEVEFASADMQGDTLVVRNLSFGFPVPEINMNATLDRLAFQERGDGTVAITMSSDMPMSMSSTADIDAEMDISMILRQSDFNMIASGDPGNITYDYEASSIVADFDKFFIDGEEIAPDFKMTLMGVVGNSTLSESDNWAISGSSNVDDMNFSMSFEDPEDSGMVEITANASMIQSSSNAVFPKGLDWADPAAAFQPDVSSIGTFTSGPVAFTVAVEGSDSFALAYGAQSTKFDVNLSGGNVAYGGTTTGGNYTFSSSDLPFPPVNVAIAETAFEFAMPLAQSDVSSDLRMLLQLQGISVDEFLWQMIDAGGQLPHDPADITIDLQGKARALADLTDPEAMAEDMEMPFEVDELTVNEISVSVAGAEIVAQGGFTFDVDDLDTFGGFPAPTGNLGLDLYGINGLLDTLGNMGLLPPEQAMTARMMMGGFTRPGDGADHLTSTVKVEGDGSVFVNGQQMR